MTLPEGASLGALVAAATERLTAAGVDSPEVDARLLAGALLGADPRRAPDTVPGARDVVAFAAALERRAAREPLQLVLGTVAFHAIELACRAGVFVPRPETEVLVELALAAADRTRDGAGTHDTVGPVHVVEPCTGSGAVALAMAAARGGLSVLATDRSPLAVAAARANRDRLAAVGALASPVEVLEGDLVDPIDRALAGRIDVLVANPPYLPDHELAGLPPEVVHHDPPPALVAGPDGHEVVDRLIELAVGWLAPGGTLLLEVDARRSGEAAARAHDGGLVAVAVHEDLTGRARFVSARRPAPREGSRPAPPRRDRGAPR